MSYWSCLKPCELFSIFLREMGSGRTSGKVVGDVWRVGHSGVGAGAPVRGLGRGGI